MRVSFYGLGNLNEEKRIELLERITAKYKQYVLEYVEGVYNEKSKETPLAEYCKEHDVKLTQMVPKWNDLTGCNNPRTSKFGRPYNPDAANKRDREMAAYVKEHKKNMAVVVTNDEDKFAGYTIWCSNQQDIPTYIFNAESGEWMFNKEIA